MRYTVQTIGRVHSPYTQKFGIARQPGLVPSAQIILELNPEFTADCIRGLDGFGYIWLHFIFHGVLGEGWLPTVRPPRLGGKRKMGVFATRSPHRPNHLGLSLLKLEGIECGGGRVKIRCSGADLLDGTPVIDIKPYIPFAEARPDAAAGFAAQTPPLLDIVWQTDADHLPSGLKTLIEQSLAQDPRPAHQNRPDKVYVMEIAGWEVKFQIAGKTAAILAAENQAKGNKHEI
ncbi:MAG: tRNA (N6-threonylcarbamoyladenosine(37)-N6)-methyltransferase TrmO [Neisseria sp.]|nr:tRNA (N6-threonylcarbamoyladenosine(37)-N6)-methyltransferase TrmO [Neisseria sp.]